jgi:hypothetical protein
MTAPLAAHLLQKYSVSHSLLTRTLSFVVRAARKRWKSFSSTHRTSTETPFPSTRLSKRWREKQQEDCRCSRIHTGSRKRDEPAPTTLPARPLVSHAREQLHAYTHTHHTPRFGRTAGRATPQIQIQKKTRLNGRYFYTGVRVQRTAGVRGINRADPCMHKKVLERVALWLLHKKRCVCVCVRACVCVCVCVCVCGGGGGGGGGGVNGGEKLLSKIEFLVPHLARCISLRVRTVVGMRSPEGRGSCEWHKCG